MFLLELNGSKGDPRWVLIHNAEVTIGRDPSNDVQLQRDNISKHHARIVRRDDTIIIVDLKSTNGTYVNGRKITAPSVIVRNRDTIYIGDYRIVIHSDDMAHAARTVDLDSEPTAERLLPPYLARDPVEQRLLTEIAARDDAARVVYADWLEERGDHERAEFLRIQQQIVGSSPDDPGFEQLTSRLRALAATLDVPWRIRVARAVVERCPVASELQCPKEWGKLEPTDRDGVRYCGSCKKTVHYAATLADAWRHAESGHCVAIDVVRWGPRPAPVARAAGRPPTGT